MTEGAVGVGNQAAAGGYSTYTKAVLASSPIAYWPMNDNGVTINELIANLDGTVANADWVSTCLGPPDDGEVVNDFGTSNSLVTIPDDALIQDIFSNAGRYTVEFILHLQANPANFERVLSKEDTGTPVQGWTVYTNTGTNTISLIRRRVTTSGTFTSPPLSASFGCTHCAFSYKDGDESTDARIWAVNGQLDTDPSNTSGSGAYESDVGVNLLVGNRTAGDRQYSGIVSHVAIYDRDLMSYDGGVGDNTEVLAHYNASGI